MRRMGGVAPKDGLKRIGWVGAPSPLVIFFQTKFYPIADKPLFLGKDVSFPFDECFWIRI